MSKEKKKNKSEKDEPLKKEEYVSPILPVLIVSILKTYSSKNNPITVNEIVEKLKDRIYDEEEEGKKDQENNKKQGSDDELDPNITLTTQRKLKLLVNLGRGYEKLKEDPFYIDIYRSLGGRVCKCEKILEGNEKKRGRKPWGYYFEPILSESDLSYICAALESTHFLTKEEKKYMICRERAAYGNWNKQNGSGSINKYEIEEFQDLPQRPDWSRSSKSDNTPSMLNNIQKVLSAINNKHQIEINYGKFVVGEKSHPKLQDKGKKYCLNPYFIVSQKGLYYMVVTRQGEEQLNHFRLDRILNIEEKENKRERIPESLKKFYKDGEFKVEEYVSIYPLMQYPEKKNVKPCVFLCKAEALSVPVDHFGKDLLYIKKTDDEELVNIRVTADYENVKFFCVQQSRLVTPVSPEKLKEDVKKILTEAIDRIG